MIVFHGGTDGAAKLHTLLAATDIVQSLTLAITAVLKRTRAITLDDLSHVVSL